MPASNANASTPPADGQTASHASDFGNEIQRLISAVNSDKLSTEEMADAKQKLKSLLFSGEVQAKLTESMTDGIIDRLMDIPKSRD